MSPQKPIRVDLIRELLPERPGIFEYAVHAYKIRGESRQPLLDACRQIKRMDADYAGRVALFRDGRISPDATVGIDWGAAHTVADAPRGKICFATYDPDKVYDRG